MVGHHRSICPTKFAVLEESHVNKTNVNLSSTEVDQLPKSDGKTCDLAAVVSNILLAGGERVFLQTAQTFVCGKDGVKFEARVLMDSASHLTFITEQMAKCLNLQPQRTESLSVSTFGTRKPQNIDTYVVNFNIITKDDSSISLYANVLQQITSSIRQGPLHQVDGEFLQAITPEKLANNIPIQSTSVAIDILVGLDYFWNIIDRERIILPSGLLLLSSKLGYVLTGRYSDPTEEVNNDVSSCMVTIMPQSDSPCLSDFWSLETIGISDPIHIKDDDRALEKFNNTISYQEGQYFITWPWKSDDVELPENFDVAFGRMKTLLRRFQNDHNLLKQYREIIQ